MKTMEMRLNDKPFLQLLSGEKTVEVRLNDEKRKALCVGDILRFIRRSNGAVLTARVTALCPFSSFAELTSSDLFDKCGFGTATKEEAVREMYTYYTEEEEKCCGVLAIEVVKEDCV